MTSASICHTTNVSAEGQTVQVSGDDYDCEEEDVINPALDKLENPSSEELNIQLRYDVLRRRTDWVRFTLGIGIQFPVLTNT